jgi:hypothetical protein
MVGKLQLEWNAGETRGETPGADAVSFAGG